MVVSTWHWVPGPLRHRVKSWVKNLQVLTSEMVKSESSVHVLLGSFQQKIVINIPKRSLNIT